MKKEVRELKQEEFPLAEKVWAHYRGQKADPAQERIFGVFVDGALAATARCTRHQVGLEMDCVFTLDEYRGSGYAKEAVQRLLEECGSETIYLCGARRRHAREGSLRKGGGESGAPSSVFTFTPHGSSLCREEDYYDSIVCCGGIDTGYIQRRIR